MWVGPSENIFFKRYNFKKHTKVPNMGAFSTSFLKKGEKNKTKQNKTQTRPICQ